MFETYRLAMKEDQKRTDKARADCRKRIDAQLAALMVKRRDVKLLEHLKEQRFRRGRKRCSKRSTSSG